MEMNPLMKPQPNPLVNFMRQPKIYIKLPSKGEFYPDGSLTVSETGEYPVYSMTARDEMLLKVPDALMNGQAVVDVIQNCMPNIKNAWHVPSIDLDIILIAIRLATYGEKMVTPLQFGEDLEMEYEVDLRFVMQDLVTRISWNPVVPINDDITIFVKPLTYRQISEAALQTFETQKIIQIANDDKTSEEDKIKIFKDSFSKLTAVNINSIGNCIARVETSQGSTDNPQHIREFVNNMDKEIFNKIQGHMEMLKESNGVKPITVGVTEEMRAAGILTDTVDIPLTFDPSTFFA